MYKKLIQIVYASGRYEVSREETKPLIKAGIESRCNDLLVITWNCEDELENRKIKLLPLWKWLTEANRIKTV